MAEGSRFVVFAAVLANGAIAVAKFTVAAISGSSAILAEGIHSLCDTANECLLLLGQHRSEQPSTPAHPFGHGKELYFWSLVVAIVLFGLGGGMAMFEGITHFRDPQPIRDARWSYLVLAIAAVLEGISFFVAYREIGAGEDRGRPLAWWRRIRRSKDPSVFSVFAEDFAALLGIVVAATGITASVLLHAPRCDAIASFVIGLILATVAIALAHESRKLLIGESASPEVVERIRRAARDPAVVQIATPRTMHLAPDQLLVMLDVQLDAKLSVEQAVTVLERLEDGIRRAVPDIEDASIYIKRRVNG